MKIAAAIGNENEVHAVEEFIKATPNVDEVTAVAVIPTPNQITNMVGYPLRRLQNQLDRTSQAEESSAEEILADFKSSVERPGLTVKTVVRHGNVAGEIIKTARQEKADFVLVTRRQGERSPGESLSDVASRMARYAPCSAILLDAQNPAPKSFLYATDGSAEAKTAGQRLREIGVRDILFICTVVQTLDPIYIRTGSQAHREHQRILSEFERETEVAAQELLRDEGENFRSPNLRVRTLTYKGDPSNAFLTIIKEYNVDMLAIGAKGVSAMDEFLLGSITLKMLQRARCSILVAR